MQTTKMQKKEEKKGLGGVLFEGVGGGRIEVIVKMQEKCRRVRSWPGWM